MTFTIDDVGNDPGMKPFTDAEKQVIADQWTANEVTALAAQAAEDATPTLTRDDMLEALYEAANPAVKAAAAGKARARRDAIIAARSA